MNSNDFVNFVVGLLSSFGHITSKAMFGGHAIYNNGIIIAIILEDELYFKTNSETEKDYGKYGSEPFIYNGNKNPVKMPYWKVPAEIIDDNDLLELWFAKAYEVAIKSKKKK